MSEKKRGTKVVIVGAGIAGFSCALELKGLKARCTILEKEKTVGGRARSYTESGYVFDRIVESVATHFGISSEEVKNDKSLYRNMAIYLVKRWTSLKNTEAGDFFGGLSYSAVSKINTRFSRQLKKDRKLRRDVQAIMRDLAHVKT